MKPGAAYAMEELLTSRYGRMFVFGAGEEFLRNMMVAGLLIDDCR